MKCPIDNQLLSMSDKNGVEIDYCPDCRGVWLDRGELDKIIEKTETSQQSMTYSEGDRRNTGRNVDSDRRHDYNDTDSHTAPSHHKKKKRESFLGDLFEF